MSGNESYEFIKSVCAKREELEWKQRSGEITVKKHCEMLGIGNVV